MSHAGKNNSSSAFFEKCGSSPADMGKFSRNDHCNQRITVKLAIA
jgi:hypothetical protein